MQGIIMGNIKSISLASLTISPAAVAQGTTAEQTFTLTGVKVGDHVFVNKPTNQAALGITGVRVTAADTIGISFANVNDSGGNITPTASQAYSVLIVRPEDPNNIPTKIDV